MKNQNSQGSSYRTASRDAIRSAVSRGQNCICHFKSGVASKVLAVRGDGLVVESEPKTVKFRDISYVEVFIQES
jgi:hypothetical protein